MSIDEVMDRADLYRIAFDTDLAGDRYQVLRAAIEQHVAEAVTREREECARACEDVEAPLWDEYVASYNGAVVDCVAAIRARAEKETK